MSKKKTRKSYSKQFKLDVIQQSYQRENIRELASELGLRPAIIYKWRATYNTDLSDPFPGKGVEKVTPEQAELRMERDILKKAIGIFPDTNG